MTSFTFTNEKFADKYILTDKQASLSLILTALIESAKEYNETIIDLPSTDNIIEQYFKLACEYMIHHDGVNIQILNKYDRYAAVTPDLKKLWDEWDINFINNIYNNDMKNLGSIIEFSNYIGCVGLLHLATSKIASIIKHMPIESVQNIVNGNARL